jgi:hypothetical protein
MSIIKIIKNISFIVTLFFDAAQLKLINSSVIASLDSFTAHSSSCYVLTKLREDSYSYSTA